MRSFAVSNLDGSWFLTTEKQGTQKNAKKKASRGVQGGLEASEDFEGGNASKEASKPWKALKTA